MELNAGLIGVVIHNRKERPTRPLVRVLFDSQGRKIYRYHELDLTELPNVLISSELGEHELKKYQGQ